MKAELVFVAMARHLGVLLVVGVLISLSACSPTQTAPPVVPQGGETGAGLIETVPLITVTVDSALVAPQEIRKPSRGNPKLDSSLNQLLETYHQGGLAEAQAFAAMHMMVLDGDRVQVELLTTYEMTSSPAEGSGTVDRDHVQADVDEDKKVEASQGAMGDLIAAIEAVGGEYQGHYEAVVQALVPINALESLAQRPDVQAIREPQRAVIP